MVFGNELYPSTNDELKSFIAFAPG